MTIRNQGKETKNSNILYGRFYLIALIAASNRNEFLVLKNPVYISPH